MPGEGRFAGCGVVMGNLPSPWALRLLAVPVLALGSTFVTHAGAPPTDHGLSFGGVVRDTVGALVGNVEVLLVDPASEPTPRATTRSDAAGKFHFEGLDPAVYRIAALKDGYLTFIGKVDPQLERWVQVVLQPMPQPGIDDVSGAIPADSTWALRRPKRYVLQEKEPAVAPAVNPVVEGTTILDEALRMQVDQLFPVASGASAGDADQRPEIRGSETRLRVASAVGDHARIDVRGYRRLADSSSRDGDAFAAASRDAAALSLALMYDTGSEGRIDVNAFYNQAGVELSSTGPEPTVPSQPPLSAGRSAHREWGYDARWSRDLDTMGNLDVRVDYHDTSLRTTATSTTPISGGADQLYARAAGASGVWTTAPLADHAVQVDVNARVLDASDPTMPVLVRAVPTMSSLSLGLNVQDTWSVGGPFAVIYGLGYRHALGTRDAALVLPQLGAQWHMGRLEVSGVVSYVGVTGWDTLPVAPGRDVPRPDNALGYEADVDLPLAAGVHVTAAALSSPIQLALAGYSGGGFLHESRPLYLTDGNAAVSERRVALVREQRALRLYLEWTGGLAEGTLATIAPYDAPLGFLTQGDLDYRTGRFGIHVFPSGTDLLFQYQILNQSASGSPGASTVQRSYEVQLSQNLMDLDPLGSWRFLVALRRASAESDELDGALRASEAGALESLNHQLSAGLSVSF